MRRAYLALIAVAASAGAIALIAGCSGSPGPGLERGRLVYDTCVPCHGKDGGGSLELRAPSIAGLPQWYLAAQLDKFRKDMRGMNPDDAEGLRMRPMAKTLHRPGDVESVAQYVASLPPVWVAPSYPMADTTNGRERFSTICITCHMADGKGNKDLGAPPLPAQPDWYLVAQLRKFHDGWRGMHPEDAFGAQMQAMSMTLEDSTAMHNVVAYIKTLPH